MSSPLPVPSCDRRDLSHSDLSITMKNREDVYAAYQTGSAQLYEARPLHKCDIGHSDS